MNDSSAAERVCGDCSLDLFGPEDGWRIGLRRLSSILRVKLEALSFVIKGSAAAAGSEAEITGFKLLDGGGDSSSGHCRSALEQGTDLLFLHLCVKINNRVKNVCFYSSIRIFFVFFSFFFFVFVIVVFLFFLLLLVFFFVVFLFFVVLIFFFFFFCFLHFVFFLLLLPPPPPPPCHLLNLLPPCWHLLLLPRLLLLHLLPPACLLLLLIGVFWRHVNHLNRCPAFKYGSIL